MEKFSRRKFLLAGFLSSAVFLMDGCSLFGVTTPIDTIATLHHDLFPQASELGIVTAPYMHIIFHQSHISKSDKVFIKNGVKWLNEEAIKTYKITYTKLSFEKRQKILQTIAKTQWGENFLYDIMGYMFEAMLGDPIYGGNNNEAGWKWLAFHGGRPRPKEAFL